MKTFNQYCQTPLMLAFLLGGYLYAIAPQIDTLAPVPHLLALAYLALYSRFHSHWSVGIERLIKLAVCLLCGYTTWLWYGLINGIDPGTCLLSAAVILKFSELRRYKDYFTILLINLYILNTNFLYSFNYFLTLYVIVGNLLFYYLMVVCSSGISLKRTLDFDSRASYPAMLLKFPAWVGSNLRELKDTYQHRYAIAVTGWMLGIALPIAGIIFFAYPRVQLNILNLEKSTKRAMTGFSPYMEPGRFTELYNDDRVAFRVKFLGAVPPPEQLYWRALVLEEYNGRQWRNLSTSRPFLPGRIKPSEQTVNGDSTAYTYEVILPDHRSNWLFSLDHPLRLENNALPIFLDHKGQLSTPQPPEQVITYTLYSQTNLLNRSTGVSPQINLSLPPNEAPRARALAAEWQGSPRDKLNQAIAWYKKQKFIYSMTVKDMSVNTIDRFLFEEKAGFCEFFASSFTFLMRAAGVPARVVIGYQGGLYSEAGATVRIHQYTAHAWTEVLLPDLEHPDRLYWHRVDPTVLSESARLLESPRDLLASDDDAAVLFDLASYPWVSLMRDVMFELNFIWDRWILSYSGAERERLLEMLRSNDRLWLNLLLIVCGTFLLSVVLFRLAARRLSRSHDPLVRLLISFRRTLKKLEVETLPWHGCQTMARRALAHMTQTKGQERVTETIERFSQLWQQARYRKNYEDKNQPPDRQTLHQLRRLLSDIK